MPILLDQHRKAAPPIGDHRSIADRLCRKAMGRAGLEPEDVAREMEGVDLAPAIAQQLVGPDGSRHDLVEIFRVVAFREQFFALAEQPLRRHGRHPRHCCRHLHREDGWRELRVGCGLGLHGTLRMAGLLMASGLPPRPIGRHSGIELRDST